jgi:ribonucleoside-diphosphate reductase alpha chain
MSLTHVRKRDGRLEKFDPQRISSAITKAFMAVKAPDGERSKAIAQDVITELKAHFSTEPPSVEEIQDIVEKALMRAGETDVTKAYMLYRQKRAEVRAIKRALGVTDELKLSINAVTVLQRRYLLRDDQGNIKEMPAQLFRRVARSMTMPDKRWLRSNEVSKLEDRFYEMMAKLEFVPNTPTLMNAGTPLGQLSACFVIPVEDSLAGIFDALKATALIQQSGGGTGFSFSRLRPKGDIVRSTKGIASGPVTFMGIFDEATNVIKQGGKRRGANMGILRVDHPDIIEFITAKSRPGFLSNFNISVAATDKFMDAVEKDKDYELVNPRNGEVTKKMPAREVWDLIIDYAWRTGDPGLIFIDRINKLNPTSNVGLIEATNPCGEQPLHPWDSCNLGSISLPKMLKQDKQGKWEMDWDKLKETVHRSVRFLDNVIDANKYPLPEIAAMTRSNRRIGLGVMGFADALLMMGIPYDSEPALKMGTEIAKFVEEEGHKASQALGKEKGSFPNFKGSLWEKKGYRWMRNATVTTIAPTGTISIIAGVSSGIEPLFAVSFVRNVLEGTKLLEVNSIFERVAKERGFYSPELMHEIAKSGSVQKIKEVPADVKKVFKTALDIAPEWHVKMQAAWQKYCDNAVSKTINFPPDATKEDVRKAYQLAWRLGNKGITIYRYGSKPEQVLYIGEIETREKPEAEKLTQAPAETAGWCPFGQHCPAT